MRVLLFCISCVALLMCMVSGAPLDEEETKRPVYDLNEAPQLFEKYIKDYQKTYKDDADKQVHYEAFQKSLKSVNELNSKAEKDSATFDINNFSDFTDEEQKSMFGYIAGQ